MQSKNKINIASLIKIALFASLIVIATIIIPPIYIMGVPVTLQSLMIMVIASLLNPSEAVLSVSLYLILGIIGLPVFSGYSSGFGVLLGPTGGFLLSFIFAGYFISYLKQESISRQIIMNIIFGVIIVYLIGSMQMAIVNQVGYFTVLKTMIVFIPFDIIKAFIAGIVYKKTKHVINKSY